MDKKYRTRNGRDIRVLCVDKPGSNPVVVVDRAEVYTCTKDGRYWSDGCESIHDLIEVIPQTVHVYWSSIFPDGECTWSYKNKATLVDRKADGRTIYKITSTWAEGKLVDIKAEVDDA
jgi:hypothetical protein